MRAVRVWVGYPQELVLDSTQPASAAMSCYVASVVVVSIVIPLQRLQTHPSHPDKLEEVSFLPG